MQFEPGALNDEQKKLAELGYELKQRKDSYGNMHAVFLEGERGLKAASDPRWLGLAEVRPQGDSSMPELKTGTDR